MRSSRPVLHKLQHVDLNSPSLAAKGVRLSANLSWLFKDVPFAQRFQRAAACGFRGVEFLFDQYEHKAEEVHDLLHEHDLESVLLNCPPGDWAAGDRGTGCLLGRGDEYRESVVKGIKYAMEIECPTIHVMAGVTAEEDRGACEERFIDRLRWACDAARGEGLDVCIEPLNARDVPGYLLPDTHTALRILDAVDKPNAKLQLDLYHLAVTEGDLSERITDLLDEDIIGHVQLANPPGRHEPGVGDVDFPPLLAQLDEGGYEGWVGCEYVPSTATTEESLKWAREFGITPP